ncbi:ABC transporter transmembrane domain-containing protein [Dactylosporangium sp. CS-047395]|uniref:ABC transporter transmembrane domain-containing protein n=1 Tax=Dactylosporangium sp. CS-047395 TaxID=3239936 RepID=UPI003D8C2F79
MTRTDPAGLGRGPLTRRLPVLGQAAPAPPAVRPYAVGPADGPGRFLARVIFSVPRVTVPAMVLSVVWQVGESAVPVVMGLAIDRALATGNSGQLVLWISVLVALYAALTLAARLSNRLNVHAVQMLQHRLRTTLSIRVLHPVDGRGNAARAPDGGVVSTMTNDVGRLSNAVLLTTIPVARIAAIGFIAASLLVIHWFLGVLVLVGAPLVVWLMGILSKRLARSTRVYQGLLAATVGRATDLVAGYRVIKGIRAEREAVRRYVLASQETLDGAKRNAGLLGRFQAVSGVVNGVFVAAVTGLAAWFALDGRLSIGELIATAGLTQALLPQIQGIASLSIPNLANAHASAARILDTCRPQQPAPPFSAPGAGHLDICFSGTAISVGPGELVGIRADDRTAARLADALLYGGADAVQVRLGGRPAGELSPAQYRARITVAPHRTMLFTGTIRANLTTPASAPDRLTAALAAAACDDFATDLDAPVGENGNRLSGGQRQRIALARALATDAPVLVLHDPTTAVDPVTEQTIAERLRRLRADRTTVLIASSPALLGRCDRVIDLHANQPAPYRAAAR